VVDGGYYCGLFDAAFFCDVETEKRLTLTGQLSPAMFQSTVLRESTVSNGTTMTDTGIRSRY
jgi:hypothetical protein